jgi:dUTPase
MPKRATDGAAGFDLTAVTCKYGDNGKVFYDTGIAEIPPPAVLFFVRGSMVAVRKMKMANVIFGTQSRKRGAGMSDSIYERYF